MAAKVTREDVDLAFREGLAAFKGFLDETRELPGKLDHISVVRCGVCGQGFFSEEHLQSHVSTAQDEDGDLHDGEPWVYQEIRRGDKLIWEPHEWHAVCAVVVTDITLNSDKEVWVETQQRGDTIYPTGELAWNEAERLIEACFPASKCWSVTPYCGNCNKVVSKDEVIWAVREADYGG